MNDTIRDWLNRTFGAFIQGGSHSITAFLATAGAAAAGVPIQPINLKQAAGIFVASGLMSLFKVLEKVPLPGFKSDTTFFTKPTDQP